MLRPYHPIFLLFLACCSCSSSGAPEQPKDTPLEPEVLVGVPGGQDELDFEKLEEGDPVELETFGQGGTHISLAIRCISLGTSAFVRVSVENLDSGAQVQASTSSTNPRPLICRDETTCDLLPFLVMMSGITEPGEEIDGLLVEVLAEVQSPAGDSASGSQIIELRANELL